MGDGGSDSYIGLLTLLSLAFSVMAAVMAIDMHALLRTGRFGSSWRVLIIASVMFALLQVLRLVELFRWSPLGNLQLSQIVQLMFVMAFAYAMHLQRRVFARAAEEAKSAAEAKAESSDDELDGAPASAAMEDELWPEPPPSGAPTRKSWGAHSQPHNSASSQSGQWDGPTLKPQP